MMEELIFSVNQESCVQCGLCAGDCPFGLIGMDNKYPELKDQESCIRCQHCFAICPTGSLSILGLSPEDSTELKNNFPSPEEMITLVKGRRSVRQTQGEIQAHRTA